MRIDASKIILKGTEITFLVSYRILGCRPSGPGALYMFSLSRALRILKSLNSTSERNISRSVSFKITFSTSSTLLVAPSSMVKNWRSNCRKPKLYPHHLTE